MESKKKIIVEVCYTQYTNGFPRETILTIPMPTFNNWEQYEILEASEIPYTAWTKELKDNANSALRRYTDTPSEWELQYIEFIGEVD